MGIQAALLCALFSSTQFFTKPLILSLLSKTGCQPRKSYDFLFLQFSNRRFYDGNSDKERSGFYFLISLWNGTWAKLYVPKVLSENRIENSDVDEEGDVAHLRIGYFQSRSKLSCHELYIVYMLIVIKLQQIFVRLLGDANIASPRSVVAMSEHFEFIGLKSKFLKTSI